MEIVISVGFGVWIIITALFFRAFTKPGSRDGKKK